MISPQDLSILLNRRASASFRGENHDRVLAKKPNIVRRRRDYRVYVPKGYDGKKAMPMVMVLHGCRQNHEDIQSICGFDAIADREQFIVVYPFITSYSGMRTQNCWGWWLSRQRKRDKGENGDLHQIAAEVIKEFAVDSSRMHVCGLSAGAAMSVAAMTAYSDIWRSGASVAGVPYGESANAVKFSKHVAVRLRPLSMLIRSMERILVSTPPKLLIIQSTTDEQVSLRLAENLRECWRAVWSFGLYSSTPPDWTMTTQSGESASISWNYDQHSTGSSPVEIGYFTVDGLPHGWVGGNPGQFSATTGPNISELIWAFFERS